MTAKVSRRERVSRAVLAAGRDRRGVAAVEFVVLAPVFMLIMAGLVDFGGVLYTKFGLGASVSAATNYATLQSANVNSSSGAALATSLATVAANAQGTAWANATVTVNAGPSAIATAGVIAAGGTAAAADSCYCPTGTANALTWGGPQTCAAACPVNGYAGKFVVVTASKTYKPFFSSYGLVQSGSLTTSSIVQVQ